MSDVWSLDGALPAPFQHLKSHLIDTGVRLRSGLDGNMPVLSERRGALDDAVAQAADPSAESALRTLTGLDEMLNFDGALVRQLQSVLAEQEQDAMDHLRTGGTGPGR